MYSIKSINIGTLKTSLQNPNFLLVLNCIILKYLGIKLLTHKKYFT